MSIVSKGHIRHSDQGCNNKNDCYQKVLKGMEMQRMSCKYNCYDNAIMENIKLELIYLHSFEEMNEVH